MADPVVVGEAMVLQHCSDQQTVQDSPSLALSSIYDNQDPSINYQKYRGQARDL